MAVECGICLQTLVRPVSVPCGHVFCGECLQNHINAGTDATSVTSVCPSCRAKFSTVSPNLACVPQRYHAFVAPAVRPLFVDATGNAELKAQIKALTEQVKTLKNSKAVAEDKSRRYKNHVKMLNEELGELQKSLLEEQDKKIRALGAARRLMEEHGSFAGTATKRSLPDASSALLEPEPKRTRHSFSNLPG